MITRAVEDYLKTIYRLQRDGSRATTNAIAGRLGVRAASVTSMLRQLSDLGLADYAPYRGALLTETGLETALKVVRRHRLVELYIHQFLDVPWDRVHEEAERLEHAISPYLEDLIDSRLGHPLFDPHGSPIPTGSGNLPILELVPLSALPVDTPAAVRYIPDEGADLLRYIASLGLVLDANVTVISREPFDGPLFLRVGNAQGTETVHAVGAQLAQRIFVRLP